MKKPIIVLALLMISFNSFAQVTSPLLNCVDIVKTNFQFTAQFNGQTAVVSFKGWTYDLRFRDAYVSPQGERWSYYENKEIRVGTTFPFDKYVVINSNSHHVSIASNHCK
jgi:hypothetical protein